MRLSHFSRFVSLFALLLGLSIPALADLTLDEAAKLLPNKVGDARAAGAPALPRAGIFEHVKPADIGALSTAARTYVSADGDSYGVQLITLQSDAAAYAFVMNEKRAQTNGAKGQAGKLDKLDLGGTAAFASGGRIYLSKGATVAVFSGSHRDKGGNDDAKLLAFARSFAGTLDAGSGEIPVLVKHLPDWEAVQDEAAYAVSSGQLQQIAGNRPVLDAVSFEGGTEAVSAIYQQAGHLLIVEYATPQIASDADARIKARIAALPGEGKPAPSAYRRVGNYAVFVFDAPDEQAAAGLIDKVTYEKDVRWLGENPYAVERANRAWLNMSTSVIVNTVKATGLAIIICLSIGGVFGGWIFMRRRAQAALTEKFSDAGGMLRLNIDELSAQNNAARLLGQGDK
ncbi:MAG TPA: hypothetical protein VGX24_04455 [Pyrinomonadaceae bacterium]|jgi:hypothetical protein|nr:hypothetical protein [Pyrinomonadaceae bacterium]